MSDSRALGHEPVDDGLPTVPGESVPTPKDRTKQGATKARGDAPQESGRKKRGLFARISLFVSQVVAEMKKVSYPSKSETWAYFTVVIVFVAVIMAYTGLLDLLFGKLNVLIFG